MEPLVGAHLGLVIFWLGVVAVEAILEVLGELEKVSIDAVAKLHQATDRYLEVPLLVGIAGTGLALWARVDWSVAFLPKALAGLATVGATMMTAVYVERRARGLGDVERNRAAYGAWGVLVLLLIPATLYLGGRCAGWW